MGSKNFQSYLAMDEVPGDWRVTNVLPLFKKNVAITGYKATNL